MECDGVATDKHNAYGKGKKLVVSWRSYLSIKSDHHSPRGSNKHSRKVELILYCKNVSTCTRIEGTLPLPLDLYWNVCRLRSWSIIATEGKHGGSHT